MNRQSEVLVLGAGYAGLMAAVRLSRRSDAHVTVIDGQAAFYERVRLHQYVVGQVVPRWSMADFLAPAGVDFLQGRVEQIEPASCQVIVQTKTGRQTLSYDRLIYALGSMTDRSVPGVAEHAYTLDHRSAPALRERLIEAVRAGEPVVVVGGGGTGLEAAAEVAESFPGLKVTLLTRGEPGDFLSPKGQAYTRQILDRLGVTVVSQARAQMVTAESVVTSAGTTLPASVCIWTGGFVASPLAREAGLPVNERGQLLVDAWLHSVTGQGIYAAGDAARPVDPIGAPPRMSLYNAVFMGAYVADAVAADLAGRQHHPFTFAYIAMGISLGRAQGLVQYLQPSTDKPYNLIVTGRLAILFKDFFTNFALWAIHLQRRAPGLFYWFGKGKWRRLPAPARTTGRLLTE